jgi:ribosomal-protein-serine acetyltransferase
MLRTAPELLRTARLELRVFRAGDGGALCRLYTSNRDRFANSFPGATAGLVDADAGERYVAEKEADRNAGTGYWYGMWEGDALVGQIQIKKIDRAAGRDREGRGLVAEALRAILRACFVDLGLHKVYLRTIVGNGRSEALARRFGFVLEGTLREEHATPGGRVDVHYFGLLASEFAGS